MPDGTLVSLPIPLGPSPVTYRDVYHNGSPLADLVTPLSRGRVTADHPCHLDPDLRRESRARLPGWRPIFGQCGPALSHLRNEGVKPGDLFIFFGWFREVIREGGSLRFSPEAPDLHVIFGWLQAGVVVDSPEEFAAEHTWARGHPHVEATLGDPNGLFVAASRLQVAEGIDLPGAGTFPRYASSLQLTKPGATRRHWSLPRWFLRESPLERLSYHRTPQPWREAGDQVELASVGRGQEFVMELPEAPDPRRWLADLFQ